MKNNSTIPELIFKKISESISDEEFKELTAWINRNEENKQIYDDLLDEEYIKNALNEYSKYDVHNAWIKTEVRLKLKKAKFRLLSNSLLRYAAILIISLLIGSYYYYQSTINEDAKIAQTTIQFPFKPGSQKALLTLSNGEKIGVGKNEKVNTIKISASTEILDTNYTLVYDKSNFTSDNLEYHTLTTPKGGEYSLVLADGSKIWLNAASELKYPVSFSGSERKVYMEGEAYFEIAKNKDKPFIVHTKGYDVEVLGTKFNVIAYNDEQQIATTLDEGSVKITTTEKGKPVYLTPGQQAVLHKNSAKIDIVDVDTYPYSSWKNGLFVFQSESLGNITRKISRWYNCEFQFADADLENARFTGTLSRDTELGELLKIISQTCAIEFAVNQHNTIVISKTY